MNILDLLGTIPESDKREAVLKLARGFMEYLPAPAREAFLSEITEGYCKACGSTLPCHCENGE